jgi:hypothetical protein
VVHLHPLLKSADEEIVLIIASHEAIVGEAINVELAVQRPRVVFGGDSCK